DVGDLHPKIGLRFSVETKSRDDYPQWFENAHRQAWRNAPEGTLPVCMWHKTGQRHTEDRVDMRYEDWKALLAYIKELERGGPDGERPAA
ncbi:MAG TPA: hypothetical protein VMX14_06070, partial [Anaerolineae bacterium]|nr:hypothetical protein [Anaerolineae bacterium]